MALEESIALLAEQMRREEPTPETMKLLRAIWPTMGIRARLDLLSHLGGPPSREQVERWREDDELHRRLLRQWRWLVGVSEDLPEPWRTAHEHLSSAFGLGDPEARRYRIGARWGSVSPLSAEEISKLGPRRFADWAAEWEPSPRGWEAPTPEGLAGEISKAVQSSPEVWSGALPAIAERLRHPTYIRGILDGLREALKAKEAAVAWDRLVPTFELVVSEPWPVARLAEDNFDADPDWAECNRVVTRLIQEAADRDMPFDDATLDRLWSVLLATMRKRERETGVSGADLLTAAINKMSTTALQAMFSVALSVSRRGGNFAPWGGRLADAVSEELAGGDAEARLASAIVASLFPQFVHVGGERAKDFIPRLFGLPDPTRLKIGVLETLLRWARPITNDMLILFRPYVLAYLALETPDEDEEEEREAVQWLMVGYIRHLENQDDPRALLDVLQRPSRISEGAEFFGQVLRQTSEPDPTLIEAALRFWDEALNTPGLEAEAFQGFGWWAEGSAIDNQAWLDRIYATLQLTRGRIEWEDEVVQRLIRQSDHPDAWRSLSLLVKGASNRWTVSYWARNLHDLFKKTQDSSWDIRTLRAELAERLLERELLDFRQYLRQATT
jgi:hypothetical protein